MARKCCPEGAEFDLTLNVLDIVAIVIAIVAISISIFITTHTSMNKEANENALEELKEIRKLLEKNYISSDNENKDKGNFIYTT